MKILAIDSSGLVASAAILDDDVLIGKRSHVDAAAGGHT